MVTSARSDVPGAGGGSRTRTGHALAILSRLCLPFHHARRPDGLHCGRCKINPRAVRARVAACPFASQVWGSGTQPARRGKLQKSAGTKPLGPSVLPEID